MLPFLTQRTVLALGLTVILVSCGVAPAAMNNSMSFDELGTLQCKTIIETFVKSKGTAKITLADAEGSPQCPVAKEQTYRQSLSSSLGQPFDQVVIACYGGHHTAAGFPPDYPRHDPGKGMCDNPEGQRTPACFGLMIPEDAKIVATGAEKSTARVSFTTDQDFAVLADGYYRMLHRGQEQVLAFDPVKHGVSGDLGGIPYSVAFDASAKRVDISWDPPLMHLAKSSP